MGNIRRIATVVGVAGLLALLSVPAFAASVTPTLIAGADNKTCAELQGAGQTWSEFKVDPPANGTYAVGGGSVTITNFDGTSFDWTATFGVDAVFVKSGSNGSNLYVYDPPAESTGDTNLESPAGDPQQNISHIAFCYDGSTGGSSPSPSPSPSQSTPASVAPRQQARVLGTQLNRALPATGAASPMIPASGAAFVVVGLAMVAVAHRRVVRAATVARESIGDWTARLDRYFSKR